MTDRIKIIAAISSAIIAVSACVSMIMEKSAENNRAVIVINPKSSIVESHSEQVTSLVTSSVSTSSYQTTVTSAVFSVTSTKSVTTVSSTTSSKPKNTDVPVVSFETETSDFVDDVPYIDINTAEKEDLTRIKGIGDYLADEIIYYRNETGGFNNIEEIMNVNGIGEKIFAEIRDFIYVENPVYPVEEVCEEIISDEPEYQEEILTEPPLTLDDCIPININTADKEILMLLPYVDESVADEIIQLRTQLGAYSNTYELLYLQSLSQNQIAEIIDYLTV
ncbi:MAG: helix-hairpin-helix domain-containing protein [Ruminococcus sp.]|nr:helix-hairpin-helix domain-containing protein [Ruminococcus sp.]